MVREDCQGEIVSIDLEIQTSPGQEAGDGNLAASH
jgi:hypothetical protein